MEVTLNIIDKYDYGSSKNVLLRNSSGSNNNVDYKLHVGHTEKGAKIAQKF